MLESAWLFVGSVAALATGLAVYTDDDGVAIMFGTVGFIAWAIWTFGSLDVRTVSSGVVLSFTMPAVTLLGVVLALVPGFIALTGPIDLVGRATRPDVDDL